MLLYVEWKFDLDKNDKINILRILTEKDNAIKYKTSTVTYLLGTQTILLDQEYDTNTIYFTRVKIGSGSSICNKDKNDLDIFIKETIYNNKKTIDVYIFANKIGMTVKIKDSYNYDILSGDNLLDLTQKNKILNCMVKNLKRSKIENFNSRGNDYIYQISTIYLND